MNYELAKKLKEAGFPIMQKSTELERRVLGPGIGYYPTLSELIEACGDMFGQLIKYDPDKGHLFVAIGEYPRWEMEAESKIIRTEPYSTPEEAVANLWLELNKEKVV